MKKIEMNEVYEQARMQSSVAEYDAAVAYWKEKGIDFLNEYREEHIKVMEELEDKIRAARYNLENLERVKFNRLNDWGYVLIAISQLEAEEDDE